VIAIDSQRIAGFHPKIIGAAGKLQPRVVLLVEKPMSAKPIPVMSHEELRPPLIRYLSSLGLSHDECQDVAQEAFLKLHRHVTAAGAEDNPRSWLFRVAHNEARNRQKMYERRYGSPIDGVDAPGPSDPERELLDRERYRRLDEAMRALPEMERQCLVLRGEGLRYREIAEVLGSSTSTVADMVERAIRKLAEKCNV